MIILLDAACPKPDLARVTARVKALGFTARLVRGARDTAVCVSGHERALDPALFAGLPGVRRVIPATSPLRLAQRGVRQPDTVVEVRGVRIGGRGFTVIAGPCAVESRAATLRLAAAVKKAGAHMLRGGAFKPRTSPYSFQGLGEPGLKILAEARDLTGLPVVSEALDQASLELVARYADMVQIGSRSMQNFPLLRAAGRLSLPILLKRGFSATLEEWLLAAEYVLAEGNRRVVLCERSVRAVTGHPYNTLDLNSVLAARRLSHLPVLADPSHGSGVRDQVAALARAAAVLPAHGVLVEVHERPEQALSDGAQALRPAQFARLMGQLRALAPVRPSP